MKLSHKLRSAEHISRRELEKLLKGSLGSSFEVNSSEMEQMINGIMTVSCWQALFIATLNTEAVKEGRERVQHIHTSVCVATELKRL